MNIAFYILYFIAGVYCCTMTLEVSRLLSALGRSVPDVSKYGLGQKVFMVLIWPIMAIITIIVFFSEAHTTELEARKASGKNSA